MIKNARAIVRLGLLIAVLAWPVMAQVSNGSVWTYHTSGGAGWDTPSSGGQGCGVNPFDGGCTLSGSPSIDLFIGAVGPGTGWYLQLQAAGLNVKVPVVVQGITAGILTLGCAADPGVGSGIAFTAPTSCTPYTIYMPPISTSGFWKGSNTANKLTMVFQSGIDLTQDVTGVLPLLNGGTGNSTQSGALVALFPPFIRNGDLCCFWNGSAWINLAGNSSAGGTVGFLTQNSGGSWSWTVSPLGTSVGGSGLSTRTINRIYKGNGTGAELLTAFLDDGTTVALTEPLNVGNALCSSLNALSLLIDTGCGAVFNSYVLQSIGSTANNMRHTLNTYLETDLHNIAGGSAEFYSLASNTSCLMDSGSTDAANQKCIGFEPITIISDPTNSGVTLGVANVIKARILLNANAHVGTLNIIQSYLPTVSAGAVVTNMTGLLMPAPGGGGTVTNSLGADFAGWQYGGTFDGTIAALVASDAVANGPICHGSGTFFPIVLHDCWYSGTGSPESVLTAAIGSTFSRRDGAAGTATYTKGSGAGNTGWNANPVTIASGTASMPTGALTTNTCASVVTVAATGTVSTDSIKWSYNAAPGSPDGLLIITPYVTTNNVNFIQCNPTSASQTPVAATLNWEVIR